MFLQDSYRIGYTYNNSAGNKVEVNITCQHLSSSYCEVDMPGIPGQLYQVRVFSVLGDVLSVGTETVHSTSEFFCLKVSFGCSSFIYQQLLQMTSPDPLGGVLQNSSGLSAVNVLKFQTLVACQKILDKKQDPDQICPVCYSDKRFHFSSRDKRNFI